MRSLLIVSLLLFSLRATSQRSFIQFNTEKELEYVTKVLQEESILDSLSQIALRNSNLLKAIDQEILMFEEEILQNKRSWISSFRFGVNMFSANTTLDENNNSVTTYGLLPTVGLNLSIDPAKLVNRKSNIRQSTTKREYSKYIQAETSQDIKAKIRNLYYEYLSSLETIHIREQALDIRLQQEAYVENKVRTGESSYEQLLIISNQVQLAKESLLTSGIEAKKKKSEIEVILGIN